MEEPVRATNNQSITHAALFAMLFDGIDIEKIRNFLADADLTERYQNQSEESEYGEHQNTFLHFAATHPDPEVLKLFLTHMKDQLESKNVDGNTPLIYLLEETKHYPYGLAKCEGVDSKKCECSC